MLKEFTNAVVEKDIESGYRNILKKYFKTSEIISPYGGDGILKISNKNVALLEFKYDYNFTKKDDIVKVLIQSLYYLKKMEIEGDIFPPIIFVGDKNECFAMNTDKISNYLDEKIDWNIAPSTAPYKLPELRLKMMEDENINPFVYDNSFDFKNVASKIIELNNKSIKKIKITSYNINIIFNNFCSNVIKNTEDINYNVSLFINILTNPDENYLHPKKKNILVTPNGEIKVDYSKFKSFFNHFDREYKPTEKEELISICDRLISDYTRRMEGAFFTPTLWVNKAHEYISEVFGQDWKEQYIVWDPACGTGNLTRDYNFKELYLSTLLVEELDIINQNNINPDATKFQFDFLNDDFDKLPEGLKSAINEGKEIIVLMNPPYGTSNNLSDDIRDKAGISKNKINEEMKSEGWGACSQQLYAQFLYRLWSLNKGNIKLCFYSSSVYKTGLSFNKFREKFNTKFKYEKGFLFNASEFSGTSKDWGINFSIWNRGVENGCEFMSDVLESTIKGIENKGTKIHYNTNNHTPSSKWIREEIKGIKTEDAPQMATAINVKQKGRGTLIKGALGYLGYNSNNVYKNTQGVYIFSSSSSIANGLSVIKENLDKVVAGFTSRKVIKSSWLIAQDEYYAPNTELDGYDAWNNDCYVYSLFNNQSQQSSLRDIEYKGKKWDILNEWFWLSKEDVIKLADEYNNNDVYRDAKNSNERFIYKKLKEIEVSELAQSVLDKATDILKKTFKYRQIMNEDHPEYHLNTWDAGWYQVKLIAKEYCKEDLTEFSILYKELENELRKGVYKFGFLK